MGMKRKSRFDISYPTIEKYFDNSSTKSFSEHLLNEMFSQMRETWKIPAGKRFLNFIEFLQNKEVLLKTGFSDEENHKRFIYTWKTEDDFTTISGLKMNAYFSHYSALFIHQLTLQIPKTFYLNSEHATDAVTTTKSSRSTLTQDAIDKAFSSPQRKSSVAYSYRDKKIVITNGKRTKKLGVIKKNSKDQCFEYTDLERTLIDIAIRPVYAGGVFEVLEAFKRAKPKLDAEKMAGYLKKLDYIYPYHQVIGFYLEKAGYSENDLKLFDKKMAFDFYLTYDIRNKAYSERWKLYYPKGF